MQAGLSPFKFILFILCIVSNFVTVQSQQIVMKIDYVSIDTLRELRYNLFMYTRDDNFV